MNMVLFNRLMEEVEQDDKRRLGYRLNQHLPEWRTFLNFVWGVFRARKVENPIVVEIGILDGIQRKFYKSLFGAEYYSIDINPKSPATIKSSSHDPNTLKTLLGLLNGRKIDLLFIDGLHTYEGVKRDWEIYDPLCKHITAFHDVLTPKNNPADTVDVIRFWEEMKINNKKDTIITIQHHNPRPPTAFNGRPLGIGVLLKEEVV